MKRKVKLKGVTTGLTLEYLATVLMDEVKAVFGECILAERLCDQLLIHFLCFHVCNVELEYEGHDACRIGSQGPQGG